MLGCLCSLVCQKPYLTPLPVILQECQKPYLTPLPVILQECQKAFKKKVQLRRHARIHTGSWPYLCDECGAGFGWYSSLQTHRRSHTGERPFICEQCGRAFRMLGHLTRHMAKLHTDEFLLVNRYPPASAQDSVPSSVSPSVGAGSVRRESNLQAQARVLAENVLQAASAAPS